MIKCLIESYSIIVWTVGLVIMGSLVFNINKYLKNKLELERYKTDLQFNLDSEYIINLLDTIVNECFNEYILFNYGFKKDIFINSEMEKEITKAISTNVMDRLSVVVFRKLALYYNSVMLADVISNKVYTLVMSYSIEANSIK